MSFHLKCLDENYELSKTCRLCSTVPNDLVDHYSNDGACFSPKLAEIIKQHGLRIIHQNIRSVTRKIDELRSLVVNELKSEIHIIALTETWASEQILDGEIEIPGYNMFRKDRDGKGGGVLVFVRSDLSVARRCDLEDTAMEGLWLEILLPKSRGFLLGTFYRPANSSHFYDQDFMLKLDNMLDIAGVQGQEMIVLGDFNCNFNVKKDNIAECKQLKLTFKTHHLTQLIKEPTRVTIDSSTLLDLIASNNPGTLVDQALFLWV